MLEEPQVQASQAPVFCECLPQDQCQVGWYQHHPRSPIGSFLDRPSKPYHGHGLRYYSSSSVSTTGTAVVARDSLLTVRCRGSEGRPSFASVVANVDSDGGKYIATSSVQGSRVEMVEDLQPMTKVPLPQNCYHHRVSLTRYPAVHDQEVHRLPIKG